MNELWSSASYEPHLLSLPFAFAPAAMLVVIAYAIAMRGLPVLRTWLLVHFIALMPYSIVMALSPSVTSPMAAGRMYRIAAAFIPLAAAAGAGFQLSLLGKQTRVWVWLGIAFAIPWVVVGLISGGAIEGAYRLSAGMWYASAGPYAWLGLVTTVMIAAPGFLMLANAAFRSSPTRSAGERRQLRIIFAANLITYSGLSDIILAYHVGVFPLGWLLSGAGSVLVVRALIYEDILRVRAVDTTLPHLILHLVGGFLLGWATLSLLGSNRTWWGVTLALTLCFVAVRVSIAIFSLVNRGARGDESTLDRLVGQLVTRARTLRSEPEVAKLAVDVVELGLGVRIEVLLAAAEDWGWTSATGARLSDTAAPDPLLAAWLAEQRGAIFHDELRVPCDLSGLLAGILSHHGARAVIPVVSHDELLAVVLLPTDARRLRGRARSFMEAVSDRLAEALVHARMAQQAATRANVAREVELAATVQLQLLPNKGPHKHGDLTIVGSWLPATRCAGDFWGVYPLENGRVLVAIGDVTGHGVASAMVTAAATAACDVIVRRHPKDLDLGVFASSLDAAIRKVGGGELSMTCFATILDPDLKKLSYVSCGHTSPYVCRHNERGVAITALVGRGNPLGSGPLKTPKISERTLDANDLIVWYTDGLVDAQSPQGEAFGDRRFQHMLKRLDRASLAAVAVHDVVHAAIAAHRAGRPRNDDETLVVAHWAPPLVGSIDSESAISKV